MYENFDDRARKVIQLANQEAQRFNHEYLGPEHLLLGIVKEGSGVAANVLKNLDVDLRKIRIEVEKLLQSGPEMVTIGKLPQTPSYKKAIESAMLESRNLSHVNVGTEHLLLGLFLQGEGTAYQVLSSLGLKLDDVREEVLNLLAHPNSDSESHFTEPPMFGQRETRTLPTIDVGKGYEHSLAALPDDVDYIQHLASELASYCGKRDAPWASIEAPNAEDAVPNSPELTELAEKIHRLKSEVSASVDLQDFEQAASLRDQVDKLRKKEDQLIRDARARFKALPPESPVPVEPTQLSDFSRMHLALFRAEEALHANSLGTATMFVEGIEEVINRLLGESLAHLVDQLLERLDFIQGNVPEEQLQACRAELARIRGEQALDLKERARLVQHVQEEIGKLVTGRSKLVCKVNVFEHGCRDVIDIRDGDTVGKLQAFLKEKYAQQIEEYLFRIHKPHRVSPSKVFVRVYSDAPSGGSSETDLEPKTHLIDIPKHNTEGITWFPELMGAETSVYRWTKP